ncbi:MAG: hypothetical protein WC702_02000 [Patescibacteria group bacterium]|jgi:hypothetical protein
MPDPKPRRRTYTPDRDFERKPYSSDSDKEHDGVEEGDEGEGDVEKKDTVREKYLAARRLEGQTREEQARAAIKEAQEAAHRVAAGVERTSGADFYLAGGDRKNGGVAAIGIETATGEIKTITEALGVEKEKAAQLSFVYGQSLRVALKKETIGGRETETAEITVPLDLPPAEFPFLIRETLRALGALETHVVKKEVGGGKGKKKKLVETEEATVSAKIIKKEIEKRKKLEDDSKELQTDFSEGRVDFINVRKKYRKLETEHSAAWCSAEGQVNLLTEEKAAVFGEATGHDLYEAYGSSLAFRKELLRRTMERQKHLVYPYDDTRTNLLLLGRPAVSAEKIQYLTFTGLFTGLWGPYWAKRAYHGRGWDIPFTDRLKPHLRDSTMVTDYILRRQLHGYDQVGGSSDSLVKRTGVTGLDMVKTYGRAAGQLAGGLGILGLAAAIELPLRAVGAGMNWLDRTLYGWQKKFGGMISKSYKPGLKTLDEKEEEAAKEYERLKGKALDRQDDKSKK